MLKFLNNNNLKFKKIANDFQLILNDAADLQEIINIDPSLWAVTSLPINSVVFNYQFLKYIDTDNNQKIHPIQFIQALKWLFNILIKYDGITTQSDILNLTTLNKNLCQSKNISYTVRTINKILKNKPKNIISLQTVLNFNINEIDDEIFLSGYNSLKKLLLFQRYMIQFANNYVTLDSLYNPYTLSIMQPGYLIMGGNYYTLAAKVQNIQQHKKIVRRSNICTIYVQLVSNNEKMILAFAITYGVHQNLYIGKTGIFIDRRNNSEWDAKVIDIIQQPISFFQAIIDPFVKFNQIIMSNIQKKIDLTKNINTLENTITKKCQQIPNQKQLNTKNNIGLNGSLSIALLGSAGAFIISALHSISLLSIISFILTVIILICLPIIIISIFKIYNRSITEFYTASGWSINPKVRLQQKMGIIFTYSPKNSIIMNVIKDDLIKKFIKQFKSPINYKKIIKIISIIILIILIVGSFIYLKYFC